MTKRRNIRQDVACLQVFRVMNHFWALDDVAYNGEPMMAYVYGCVPVSPDMGFIEFLRGVFVTLFIILTIILMTL